MNYLPALPEMLLFKSLRLPESKFEEMKLKFQNRLRSWRSTHITAMRKIIGTGTNVPELSEPNSKIFRCDEALIAAYQKKLPWDVKKEPHDITWLASGDDALGSEIFISMIEGYQNNILKKLQPLMPVTEVPNMQEFTWMLRMVRLFLFSFFKQFLTCVFLSNRSASGGAARRLVTLSRRTTTSTRTATSGTSSSYRRSSIPRPARPRAGRVSASSANSTLWRTLASRPTFPSCCAARPRTILRAARSK